MSHSRWLRLLIPGLFALALSRAQSIPDLVLINGIILSVDNSDSVFEAVAIRGEKIIAVGSTSKILSLASAGTKVLDLHGRTATPGLIDSHAHIASSGVDDTYHVKLSDVTNIGDVVRAVHTKAVTLAPGEWVQGAGWDEGKLAELRYVHAADLDKASSDNPVWLIHTTGHYGVANSYALKLAGITAATKDPPAGTIDRDANGAPTGVLKEAAMALVTHLIPPVTPAQEQTGILNVVEALHREGMTAVKDPAIELHTWEAYRALVDQNKLQERVCVLWAAGSTMDSAQEALQHIRAVPKAPESVGAGDRLLSCGAKIFMDGSGGGRTAWMYGEWNKNSTDVDKDNHGYPSTDPDVFRRQVKLFHEAGIPVGTHAIGDRAIDTVVDTYAAVLKERPTVGLRHSIIHANTPTDHAIRTMAELQKHYDSGYPEAQAPFMWWLGDTYAGNLGPVRALRLEPLKTFLDKGILWAGGSDVPVTPAAARYGIWASVERETLRGIYGQHPFGTAQSVDVHTALRSYTFWAARQLFLEKKTGSVEPGKYADIAVWDQNLYKIPAADLKNLKCEMTILGGTIVYQAEGSAITTR